MACDVLKGYLAEQPRALGIRVLENKFEGRHIEEFSAGGHCSIFAGFSGRVGTDIRRAFLGMFAGMVGGQHLAQAKTLSETNSHCGKRSHV